MANNQNVTKEQERAELHRAIWQIANDLRGSVDGWDFKQYVLGILFYRFISENLTSYINEDERRSGNKDFDYANLNETLAAVFRNIESSAKGSDSEDDPKHWDDEPFDAIVSNPPYSIRWEGDSNPLLINDPRFSPAGVLAPKSKADLAFTMHMLSWLSTSGTAAIVEFPGVLYRGGAEQKIRKYLVDNNYIDTVIQLPADLFFGTTIATCIIVLKKSKKDNKTLFIDASAEFVRGGNKNKLTDENRARILKAFTKRADNKHFARLVGNKTIGENDYNIAVSSYVAQKDTREVIDITKLNAEIGAIVTRQNKLRKAIDEIVADLEGSR